MILPTALDKIIKSCICILGMLRSNEVILQRGRDVVKQYDSVL